MKCIICGSKASWVRSTQFSGDHPFCQEHAELEDDYEKSDSYVSWSEINEQPMISLAQRRVELVNLPVTIKAIEDLELLIKYYSKDLPGPAYCQFDHVDGPGAVRVQLDRKITIQALRAQLQRLYDYLESLGIKP